MLEWFASVLSEGAGPQQPPTCGVWWCGRGTTAHIQEGHAPCSYEDRREGLTSRRDMHQGPMGMGLWELGIVHPA